MMTERMKNALVALLTVAAVGACDDPPIDPGDTEAARLQTNPSSVAVNAGDTTSFDAYLLNSVAQSVPGAVEAVTCDASIATVVVDTSKTELEPGERFSVAGISIGETCIVVSAGGFEDSIPVRVVQAGFSIEAPDSIRAGTAGDINIDAVNKQGASIEPFAEDSATFSSSNTSALFFTDTLGAFDTEESGNVSVTVSYRTLGITRDSTIAIVVLPSWPDTVAMSEASFGGVSVGDSASLDAIVRDSLGNQNRLAFDLISVEATSDNEAIATVRTEIIPDPTAPGEVDLRVWAFGESQGETTIDVTVTTVGEGGTGTRTFTIDNVAVVVPAPSVLAITPNQGVPGQTVVITGVGLVGTGLETGVTVDGIDATMFIDDATATTVTLRMPILDAPGDAEVAVTVGGVPSNTVTWTQTSETDTHAGANETQATAPSVAFPVDVVGSFNGSATNHYYEFTLAAADTVDVVLDWDRGKDIDLFIRTTGGTNLCTSATGAHPEEIEGCDLDAGTYQIRINDYSADHGDLSHTSYRITVE